MTLPISAALLALQAPTGATSGIGLIVMWGAILAIFYFLMIRPQSKQRRQHEERLRSLRKGDTIVTSGGIVGEVIHMKESVKDGAPQKGMEDHVTIKSGDTRLIVERGRIARISGSGGSASPDS
jgi:preprotein translocase subunit YajC